MRDTSGSPASPLPAHRALMLELRRLRQAAQLSQTELAAMVGYSREYVSRAERPIAGLPSAEVIRALDKALCAGGRLIGLRDAAHHERLRQRAAVPATKATVELPAAELPVLSALGAIPVSPWPPASRTADGAIDDVAALVTTLGWSDTTDEYVSGLDRAVDTLARAHTVTPPARMLEQIVLVHGRVQGLLGQRLRWRQQRDLYRVLSQLLAHACLVLGDLGRPDTAEQWGRAALACAQEAQSQEAWARTALAKTLRWEHRYAESADMAAQGLRSSPACPVRVQLASQEANAAALLGHADLARDALARARDEAARCTDGYPVEAGPSVWSFPLPRLALFTQSVARHIGDHDAALAATTEADAWWGDGHPRVTATWAQLHLGAALSHVALGDLDAALQHAAAVLDDLANTHRVATVEAYVIELTTTIASSRHRDAAAVRELGDRCRALTAAASTRADAPSSTARRPG